MGKESTMFLEPQGGDAFGVSYWLNSEFLGSWTGIAANQNYNQTLTLPNLKSGQAYVLTILLDNMGLDESGTVGTDEMKNPRGILRYDQSGRKSSAIKWKITGNLGGETYQDKARGPLNEGGLFAERQGYHLPNPPSQKWPTAKPTDGISKAGVGFYTTSFGLDMPAGFDIPMSFVFTNTTTMSNYRSQLYVNGYQFGKYVNNIGPQTSFPRAGGHLELSWDELHRPFAVGTGLCGNEGGGYQASCWTGHSVCVFSAGVGADAGLGGETRGILV
jgi:hypothetical protein